MQFEYKLFQYSTSTMNLNVDQFDVINPGWEIVSFAPMGLHDLGNDISIPLSILVLAKRERPGTRTPSSLGSTLASPTGLRTNAAASRVVPNRVTAVSAPQWAMSTTYPADMAAAINGHLLASTAGLSSNPAVVDVVIDSSGSLLLVTPEADPKTVAQLFSDAVAAVKAASPFASIPGSVNAASVIERTFTFSVAL